MTKDSTIPIFLIDRSSDLKDISHAGDAGYNIIADSDPKIVGVPYDENYWKEITYIEYTTNLRLFDPKSKAYSLVFPRSSNSKYNLLLKNSVGVVDSGYKNYVLVRWAYTFQPSDLKVVGGGGGIVGRVDYSKIYKKGDQIAQLIFTEHVHPHFQNVNIEDYDTSRGTGGFGSTTPNQ